VLPRQLLWRELLPGTVVVLPGRLLQVAAGSREPVAGSR
jgi:hypothetical protein